MDPGEIVRRGKEGIEVDVAVSPNASRSGVEGIDPWRKRLVVKVRAMPRDGKANGEMCEVLSEFFSSKVTLIRGQTNRSKTVLVPLDQERVISILEEIG